MNDETQITEKPDKENQSSSVAGISLRGWIALIVVLTVCAMSLLQYDIKEPLYTLAGMIVGYYYAQAKSQKPTQ